MARHREQDAARAAQGAVKLRTRIDEWLESAGLDDPSLAESISSSLAKSVLAMSLASSEIDAMLDIEPNEDGAARALRHATSIDLWLFDELLVNLERLAEVWNTGVTLLLAARLPQLTPEEPALVAFVPDRPLE